MSLSNCMSIVNGMSDADQEALLEKLAAYQLAGMPPEQAQFAAVDAILAQTEKELAMATDDQPTKSTKSKDWSKVAVTIPVKIEDTGEVASLTMPVVQTLDEYDERKANIQRLLECL